MKFTAEQIAKMKAATSAEELIALAKAEGIKATEQEIKAQFEAMHKEDGLADEELDNVAGGCGTPGPKYHAGQRVRWFDPNGVEGYGPIVSSEYVELQKGWYYLIRFDNGDERDFPLESEYCPVKVIG